MNRRKMISVIAIILAILMLFSLVASIIPVVFAVSEDEINELKAKRDALVQEMYAQQAVIEELEAQHADVVERKLAMDERNNSLQEQIELLKEEISTYEALIAEKALEVEAAKALEEEQLQRYRARVRDMEERGDFNILALLFNAGDLSELLASVDDMNDIMTNDKAVEDAYIEARLATEQVEAEYEAYKAGLEASKAVLDEEVAALEVQIQEATDMIASLLADIDTESITLEQITAAERAAETDVANKILEMEAEKERERQRIAEEEARRREQEELARQQAAGGGSSDSSNSGSSDSGSSGSGETATAVVGSGSFCWPTGCTYITSAVGNRYHPISGEWKYHSGMDIGAGYGASVWASDSGVVCVAGVNGGYGNCVMIDHGNGYYTLYGHLSSIAVSNGQGVSKGQVVGYVGSTGVATGPHLHFEIRYNGACLDFNNWFGGLSYAPDAGNATES